MPSWNPQLADKAIKILRQKGVEIILDEPVIDVDKYSAVLKSGRKINYSLFIWTGGVRLDDACERSLTVEKRRICIDEYSVARGSPKIYVVGDCVLVYDLKTGQPLPPSAHIALEQADIVAKNIYGEISGTPRTK